MAGRFSTTAAAWVTRAWGAGSSPRRSGPMASPGSTRFTLATPTHGFVSQLCDFVWVAFAGDDFDPLQESVPPFGPAVPAFYSADACSKSRSPCSVTADPHFLLGDSDSHA